MAALDAWSLHHALTGCNLGVACVGLDTPSLSRWPWYAGAVSVLLCLWEVLEYAGERNGWGGGEAAWWHHESVANKSLDVLVALLVFFLVYNSRSRRLLSLDSLTMLYGFAGVLVGSLVSLASWDPRWHGALVSCCVLLALSAAFARGGADALFACVNGLAWPLLSWDAWVGVLCSLLLSVLWYCCVSI